MFLARVPDALDLVQEVGLGDEIVHPVTTAASVWARGRLRPLPQRTLFGVPSSVWSLRDVVGGPATARAALDLVLPADHRTHDVSVGALVRRRLGSSVVDLLVDPLLGGVYAGRADELSLQATAPQLAAADGSLVHATRAAVPAGGDAPVFATIRGGMGRLVPAVLAASGASIVAGRLVRRLERTTHGFRVIHGATNDEQAIDADAVVVAVPATPASRLLADVAPAAAAELASIDYASVALVTTVWPAAQITPPAGSGYLVPAVAGRPVKAVTFLSSKWSHVDDGRHIVARCSIGRYGEPGDLQRPDEELADLAVAELALTSGAAGPPVATRVTRWGGGLPQYTVGHVDRVRRIRAAVAGVAGLAVAGAAYDGIGIPACIRSGRAAADQIRPALTAR
jgi:protoporphyrinogen/coproporphyrinogen III oxidase